MPYGSDEEHKYYDMSTIFPADSSHNSFASAGGADGGDASIDDASSWNAPSDASPAASPKSSRAAQAQTLCSKLALPPRFVSAGVGGGLCDTYAHCNCV